MAETTPEIRLANYSDYPAQRLIELSSHISTGNDFYADSFDIIETVLGEYVPQGSLFTYLFRRFGYPNKGSDPYKELASYLLTTTHEKMLLKITPYAGGNTTISFSFIVPHEVRLECDNWPRRHRIAHDRQLLNWIEENNLVPDWFGPMIRTAVLERQKAVQTGGTALMHWNEDISPEGITWRDLFTHVAMLAYFGEKETNTDSDNEKVRWYKTVTEQYKAEHPEPDIEWRKPSISAWDAEDPMKAYAQAMIETLEDLKRSVGIRDCEIDMLGHIDNGNLSNFALDKELDSCEPAASAGYPCGALGNADPVMYAKLHGEIALLDTDPAKAIEKALRIIKGE